MENLNKTHLELPFLKAETTLFKGPISNTIPDEQITMGQVLLGILKGRWQKEVKNVRELKNQYLNLGKTENKIKWNRAKEKLPYFTVSVSCEGGRDLNSVVGMTQFIQLDVDVDHDLGGQELIEVKKILKNDPYVGALFQSTSGEDAGVKGIVSVERAYPEEWNSVAVGLENYLFKTYRIEQDKKMRSLTQPCFVSSGGVLINPDPKCLQWRNWIDDQENKQKNIKYPFKLWDQQKWKYGSTDWPRLFKDSKMVISSKEGKVNVKCPWIEKHTKDELKGTDLFLGNGRWCFKCHHSHCADKTMSDLVDYFGEDLVSGYLKPNFQNLEVSGVDNFSKSEEWSDEPEPFFNLKRTPGKYPLEAYPPIIKNAVEAFVNYAQTPISMTASIALGYTAASVQHLALVARDEQTFGPCSLYVLNIAQSGERKSTVDRAFEKGIRELERINKEKADHYEEALSMDGSSKRIIYEDATAEGLAVELQNNNKSIVLASSEGGSIFGSVGMRGEAILKALSFFNKAWDADTQSMSRKQSESVYLKEYRVSLNIAVQFESLDYWFEKHIGLAKGIGFLGRFLVNIPDSNIGQRFYRKAPRNVHELNAFQEACVFSLGQSSDLEQPRIIDFTQEAESEWIKYFDETEEAQKVGGRWEQNKASASKSPEQAARIAAVFTLIENPGSTEIPGSVMSNAIKVTRYHLNESLRLEGQTGATLIERDAQILLKWLADQDLSSGWSTSRIKQYGPNSIRKPDRCDAALKLLEIYGYLKIINEGRKVKIRFHPKFPECIKRENQYSNSR